MNLATVTIHEFSTGIQAERTPDGGWVSRGFTGQYINKTLDPIPVAIQSAIANREFAVAEGASSNEPAIIGREVEGGGQDWSAIAVVTRGRDDRGRSASMYRYFFCEGLGNLWKILAWIESERKAGRMPIFNPFETKIVGQPNEYPATSQPQINLQQISLLQSLLAINAPVIIPAGQPCTPFIVNQMAIEKARENGQPVAWAYKAEALEQPRSFQVIQPASEKAEQLLQRAIASTPQYTAPIAGEQEVKSAIKGLISRDKVKLESVQVIGAAIDQIQDRDWEVIFNGQGASQALKQGIYSPQMVRLLTLRAIIIPQTLPDFLAWIQKRGKQEDHYQVSEIFQSEIHNSINVIPGNAPNFTLKVSQGVKLIIPRLVEQPELLSDTIWLLSCSDGIWSKLCQDFWGEIEEKENQFKSKSILANLEIPTSTAFLPEEYQHIAKLFGQLGYPKLSAFLYKKSNKVVPKEIFSRLPSSDGWHSYVYGVWVEREVSPIELILLTLLKIGRFTVPVIIVLPLLALTFIVGLVLGGGGFSHSDNQKEPSPEQQTLQNNSSLSEERNLNRQNNGTDSQGDKGTATPSTTSSSSTQKEKMDETQINKALQKFNNTRDVIMAIVNKCKKSPQETEKIFNEIKTILNKDKNQELQNNVILEISPQNLSEEQKNINQKAWVEAIYSYQQNHVELKGTADGIITKSQGTAQQLEKDLIKKSPNIKCGN